MNRRSILKFFGFGAVAAVVPAAAVEELIPVIGTPELVPWVAMHPAPFSNQLMTIHEITKEALKLWNHKNQVFVEMVSRDFSQHIDGQLKVGETVRFRVPERYTVRHDETPVIS